MGRSQQLGMFLMAGAAVDALVMLVGLARRSYWVVALPVGIAVGVLCALTFWVGWTMVNTEEDLAELEEAEAVPAVA